MKANSRRRVLISSVAMLLVAIVALGTSTYAWFTNATQAKANNLVVTANAAKGLQISTDGTTWGTNQSWADLENGTISPLSIPYQQGSAMPTTGYYAAKAGTDGAWAADTTYDYEFKSLSIGNPTDYVNESTYLLSYKVDARISGLADDDTTTAALTANISAVDGGGDLADVIRIAIVDSATGKTVYGVYGDDSIKAINSTTPELATTTSATTTGAISCGTVSKDARTLYVYMWIEGQDTECVDEVMNLAGEYKITFSIPDFA